MTSLKSDTIDSLTHNTGNNSESKGGSGPGVISCGLQAPGACGQIHVIVDPGDLCPYEPNVGQLASTRLALTGQEIDSARLWKVATCEATFPETRAATCTPQLPGGRCELVSTVTATAIADNTVSRYPGCDQPESASDNARKSFVNEALTGGIHCGPVLLHSGGNFDSSACQLSAGLNSPPLLHYSVADIQLPTARPCYETSSAGAETGARKLTNTAIKDKVFCLGVDRKSVLSALTRRFAERVTSSPYLLDTLKVAGQTRTSDKNVETQNRGSTNDLLWKQLATSRECEYFPFAERSQLVSLTRSEGESFLVTSGCGSRLGAQLRGAKNQTSGTTVGTERGVNEVESAVCVAGWNSRCREGVLKASTLKKHSRLTAQGEGIRSVETEGGVKQTLAPLHTPDLPAKETQALHITGSPPYRESFLCGGPVSLLPPIVERAEGDVVASLPITTSGIGDITAVMAGRWELQRVEGGRGHRVNVEPFFSRSLRQERSTLCQDQSSGNGASADGAASKVKKTGSQQLPSFSIRQTLLLTDNPHLPAHISRQNSGFATTTTTITTTTTTSTTTSTTMRAKPKSNSELGYRSSYKETANPTNTPFLAFSDVKIVEDSPQKTTAAGAAAAGADASVHDGVYNVRTDDDMIRVDISAAHTLSSDAQRKVSSFSRRAANSLGPCVSEGDYFPEMDQPLQESLEWSEHRGVRGLPGRQDSMHAFSKHNSSTQVQSQEDRSNADPQKQRTSSDSILCQKRVRNNSLKDMIGPTGSDGGRPGLMSLMSSVTEPSSMSTGRRHSLAVSLDSERTRRNSVTFLKARPTQVSSPHSTSMSFSERSVTSSIPRRRHSSKSTLEKFLRQSSEIGSSKNDIAASLEFLTWTHLLSTHPQSELHSAIVQRGEVMITIPVCHVSKGGATVSVTSVEAIEQTLTHFHPTIQVLLDFLGVAKYNVPSASAAITTSTTASVAAAAAAPVTASSATADTTASTAALATAFIAAPSHHTQKVDAGSMTECIHHHYDYHHHHRQQQQQQQQSATTKGLPTSSSSSWSSSLLSSAREGPVKSGSSPSLFARKAPAKPEDGPRKVSINTCIRTMREGCGNYDSQLIGCKHVGTYAEEETLKVVLAKSDAISCVINAMKAFLEREELQRQACASLLKMASTSEANCVYISQNEGVTAIMNTMRRYEDDVQLTRQALSILGYISTTEDVKAELLGYGCHSDVLAAMSRHSDDRQIVCQCCFILGNLVISVETAHQLMLVGGVHTIISMVKRYHDDRDILENGCRALGSFAVYDDTCEDVAQAGATETVVEAMKSAHADHSVLESACWALACLTCKAVTCREFVSLGGMEVVMTNLERLPSQELLQEYGVRVICNLAALDCTVIDVATSRVIRLLMSLYHNFPDNVELMEYMMLAISLVAATDAEVQQYVLTSGAVRTVVGLMRALEENPAIQENGCRTLGNMAVNESLRKATEQQGASQAVIAAMLNVDMCADVQLCGCMALMNLTADLMDNKMRVKNNGAVPTLLATLRNFQDNEEVQLSALKTLGNLVDLEEACRQLLDDRGLPIIIQIARNTRASDNIRAFAALVLSGLTALSDLPVDNLLEVEETLVTLQAALPHDPDLALSMCQGLHNLLKSEVGLDTLIQTGWMQVLENNMNVFSTHPDIHMTAVRTIGTVAMECARSSAQTQCPLSASSIRCLLQSMRQFPNHKELQIVACGTLSCVAETFEHLRKTIIQEGGLRDVTVAMTSYPTDDRLHFVGLIALSYLLPVDMEESDNDDIQPSKVISRSMSEFVENADIQIIACKALERCRVKDMDNVFELLTCVHNAVRRHNGKVKVVQAARKVFSRFGGEKAEHITEEFFNSPTGSPKALLSKLIQRET